MGATVYVSRELLVILLGLRGTATSYIDSYGVLVWIAVLLSLVQLVCWMYVDWGAGGGTRTCI